MTTNFLDLGISKKVAEIIGQLGITEPTPVQEKAIPVLLEGKDMIAQAQTGTGKTFAFALPIMERVSANLPVVQALIITPTRELALQVTAEVRKLAKNDGVNVLAAYGGQDVEQQVRKLKGAVHIVIGTPGRLLDHLRRKTIDFSKLSMLVLDEADQMLNMGFLKEVEEIIHQTPKKRQTMLFSATIPRGIKVLAAKHLREPVHVHIQSKNVTLSEIRQEVIETTDRAKQDVLCKVIDEYNPFMGVIFCRTKRRVSALNTALQSRGYDSEELHGDLTQAKREKVMKAFRELKTRFLVATDVAARGLDIEGITHVFNYDIPEDAESYIHRIGRTGRAGQTGVAVTFATSKDREFLHIIEQGIKQKITRRRIVLGERPEDVEDVHDMRETSRERSNRVKAPGGFRGKGPGGAKHGRTGQSSRSDRGQHTSRGKTFGSKDRNTAGRGGKGRSGNPRGGRPTKG